MKMWWTTLLTLSKARHVERPMRLSTDNVKESRDVQITHDLESGIERGSQDTLV